VDDFDQVEDDDGSDFSADGCWNMGWVFERGRWMIFLIEMEFF